MDLATTAELAELRRRAFGPEPDIADDQEALARLIELERLALVGHGPAGRVVESMPGADPGEGGEQAGREPPSAPRGRGTASARRSRLRGGAGLALTAALIAVGVVLATAMPVPHATVDHLFTENIALPYTFAGADVSSVLLDIPIEDVYGEQPDDPDAWVPPLPTTGSPTWHAKLGVYYGWELWIARAAGGFGDEQCIVLVREAIAKGRCVIAEQRRRDVLLVSLPAALIAPSQRPPGLTAGTRIGFFWWEDASITVMLGVAAPST